MAANTSVRNSAAIVALNALLDLLDAGSGPALVKVYTGTPPGKPADAATGTLLATLTCTDPAFADAVDNTAHGVTATASAITSDTSADNTGVAGYFRGMDSDLNVIIQGTCGTASADFILNSTSITAGDTVSCTSWTVTMPDGSD